MPTLETTDGKSVEVTPVDAAAIDAKFAQAMNDDGPDDQAPPKRQRAAAAEDDDAPKKRRGRPPREEKSRTVAKAPAAALGDDARRAGVKGIVQIGAGIALLFGKATGQQAFYADSVAVASSADEWADACAQTAAADPKFAAGLDRVCAAGPYGALIMVGVSTATQVARNHRPQLELPGTVHPDKLMADAVAKAQQTPQE